MRTFPWETYPSSGWPLAPMVKLERNKFDISQGVAGSTVVFGSTDVVTMGLVESRYHFRKNRKKVKKLNLVDAQLIKTIVLLDFYHTFRKPRFHRRLCILTNHIN